MQCGVLIVENGWKIMEKTMPKNGKWEQLEKIGNNYIYNLKNLSKRNRQALDYLYKQQESQQYKNNLRKLLKSELDKSQQKLPQKKLHRYNYQQDSQKHQLQFDPNKLKQIVDNSQLQAINQNICVKQKKLIQILGISSSSARHRKKGIKYSQEKNKSTILPSINSKSIYQ